MERLEAIAQVIQSSRERGYPGVEGFEQELGWVESDLVKARLILQDVALAKAVAQGFTYNSEMKRYVGMQTKKPLLAEVVPLLFDLAKDAIGAADSVERLQTVLSAIESLAQEKIGREAMNNAVREGTQARALWGGEWDKVLDKVKYNLADAALAREVMGRFPHQGKIQAKYSLDKLVPVLVSFAEGAVDAEDAVDRLKAVQVTLAEIVEGGRKFGHPRVEDYAKVLAKIKDELAKADLTLQDVTLTKAVAKTFTSRFGIQGVKKYVDIKTKKPVLREFVPALLGFAKDAIEVPDAVERFQAVHDAINQLAHEKIGQKAIDDVVQEGKVAGFLGVTKCAGVVEKVVSYLAGATRVRRIVQSFAFKNERIDFREISERYSLDTLVPALLGFARDTGTAVKVDSVERLQIVMEKLRAVKGAIEELEDKKYEAVLAKIQSDLDRALLIKQDVALTRSIVQSPPFPAEDMKRWRDVLGANLTLNDFMPRLLYFASSAVHDAQSVERLQTALDALKKLDADEPVGQNAIDRFVSEGKVEGFLGVTTRKGVLDKVESDLAAATLVRRVIQGFTFRDERVDYKEISERYSIGTLVPALLGFARGTAAAEKLDSAEKLRAVKKAIEELTEEKIGQDAIGQVVSKGNVAGFPDVTKWNQVLPKIESDLEHAKEVLQNIQLIRDIARGFLANDHGVNGFKNFGRNDLGKLVSELLRCVQTTTYYKEPDTIAKVSAVRVSIEKLIGKSNGRQAIDTFLADLPDDYKFFKGAKRYQDVLEKIDHYLADKLANWWQEPKPIHFTSNFILSLLDKIINRGDVTSLKALKVLVQTNEGHAIIERLQNQPADEGKQEDGDPQAGGNLDVLGKFRGAMVEATIAAIVDTPVQ